MIFPKVEISEIVCHKDPWEVEHNTFCIQHSKKPIVFFLTDTQISWWNSLKHLTFPGNELHHSGDMVEYTYMLRAQVFRVSKKYICCLYRSPWHSGSFRIFKPNCQLLEQRTSFFRCDYSRCWSTQRSMTVINPKDRGMEIFTINYGFSQ